MNPLRSLLIRILIRVADRAATGRESGLAARGLRVEHLPGGGVRVHHPALPALLDARRARVDADPDTLDVLLGARPVEVTR